MDSSPLKSCQSFIEKKKIANKNEQITRFPTQRNSLFLVVPEYNL